jgi:hypothetical protein
MIADEREINEDSEEEGVRVSSINIQKSIKISKRRSSSSRTEEDS